MQFAYTVLEVLQRLVDILPVNCVRRGKSIECSFADKCIWQKIQIYCTALLKGKWVKIANFLQNEQNEDAAHQQTGGGANFVQFGNFLAK